MKVFLLLIPVALACLTGCGMSQAMDCNRCAIQRSTCVIESNIQALDRVTENLKAMQEEG
ncbi:MAG: hypothetical protein ACE5GN_03250 [Waddliaceae bacterium]